MGTGKKATGTPIKLGGIDMLIPGVDFTTIGKVAKAYFDCVNDNGGINGRPIKYTLYTEQLNPAQEAALARKLIESDKVVGIVGNTSFAECGTNCEVLQEQGLRRHRRRRAGRVLQHAVVRRGRTWARATATSAPRRRSIRAGVKKLAIASPDTISAYADGGSALVAQKAGIPVKIFPTHLPVTDATSQLLQMYQFAGDGGGILLDFTPDTAPAFMKAAEAQGIVDKVKWGSSTPIANTFMAGQFSPSSTATSGSTTSSRNVDPTVGPDTALMFQILKKYAPKIAPQAFGADGLHGREVRDQRAAEHQGRRSPRSRTTRRSGLKNLKTDMLCKPWYVGQRSPYHIPNNTDITVDYKGGNVVVKEKCFAIAAVDKSIAQTRVWEKKFKLNTG